MITKDNFSRHLQGLVSSFGSSGTDICDIEYKTAEKFLSINGEGLSAGCPAVFIRFAGCNLNCGYCDTKWAQSEDSAIETLSAEEITEYILSTGARHITFTGGEPLFREGICELCGAIADKFRYYNADIEIETNGSIDLSDIIGYRRTLDINIALTVDYKLPSSGMEKYMLPDNFRSLSQGDSVKFVVSDRADLVRAKEIIEEYDLCDRCDVIFSSVFGRITPREIVEFVLENKLMRCRVQLQLHKYIWDPDKKGV